MRKSALPVRSALEMLRLECPEYRIDQRVIGDRLFYIADAAGPGVQPRFAQAETVDRLRVQAAYPGSGVQRRGAQHRPGLRRPAGRQRQLRRRPGPGPAGSRGVPAGRRAGHPGPAVPGPRRHLRGARRASGSSSTWAAGCRPPRTPTKPPRPSARMPASSMWITTPRCSATPATCWPAAPACSPAPGTCTTRRRSCTTGGSARSSTSAGRSA